MMSQGSMQMTPLFRPTSWLTPLLLCLLAAALPAAQPSQWTGSYEVTVRGEYEGQGVIAVGAASVTIQLNVIDAKGGKGKLHAANLKIIDGRFSGQGTVLGNTVNIAGRIDPADAKGPARAATIQATFADAQGVGGRIVGVRR